jgi:hypothetical protein
LPGPTPIERLARKLNNEAVGGGCSGDRTSLGCQIPVYQGKEPGIS